MVGPFELVIMGFIGLLLVGIPIVVVILLVSSNRNRQQDFAACPKCGKLSPPTDFCPECGAERKAAKA